MEQAAVKDTYHHHTDRESMAKILATGHIKQSTDTKSDAVFGTCTYLTKICPYASKEEVAKNNYDGQQAFWESKLGKTDVVLEIETTAKKYHGDRDVYKHDGDIPRSDIKKADIRDERAVKGYTESEWQMCD